MADDTGNGGDAPRSASSRGRSGDKRRRSGPPATALEIHPTVSDEPIEPDVESDAAIAAIAADPILPHSCPSCAMPMVAGAVFCGECGTRAVAVVPAATLPDSEVPSEPLPAPPTGSFAMAAAVVLIVGVVGGFALTSGSSRSKQDDQVAAGSPASTTTAAPTTVSTVTASTDAPVTTETTVSADGQARPTTVKVTPTTSGFNPAPPPPTQAPPITQGTAQLQATCPSSIHGSGSISIQNYGTGSGPFQISTGNPSVTVGPKSGVLPLGGPSQLSRASVRV